MSDALTRVIAEQQAEIDRLNQRINGNNIYLERRYKEQEALKDAAFLMLNVSPTDSDNRKYKAHLRETLRNQGWCLTCEQLPCECD